MTHIIETIGPWGVKTTPYQIRLNRVHAGDVVEFSDDLMRYPIKHKRCRVDKIDKETGMVNMVDGMGSAFLMESGGLSISGGPFFSLPLESLEPTMNLHLARFWNWGDNSPGAAQGVEYYIDRPVFSATEHPKDHEIRFSRDGEDNARHGGEFGRDLLPEGTKLVRSWEDHGGLTGYLFDLKGVS